MRFLSVLFANRVIKLFTRKCLSHAVIFQLKMTNGRRRISSSANRAPRHPPISTFCCTQVAQQIETHTNTAGISPPYQKTIFANTFAAKVSRDVAQQIASLVELPVAPIKSHEICCKLRVTH